MSQTSYHYNDTPGPIHALDFNRVSGSALPSLVDFDRMCLLTQGAFRDIPTILVVYSEAPVHLGVVTLTLSSVLAFLIRHASR